MREFRVVGAGQATGGAIAAQGGGMPPKAG